ncbi:Beclin-1 [Trichinella spiralis]|uniref:Beclin-1 n=1 Tax=Trichinella spiralis TaxID=6334 RepID=A0ABR3KKE2_TRISP
MSLATTVVAEVAKEILKSRRDPTCHWAVELPRSGSEKNKHGSVRFCVDYRKRNAATRIEDTRHAGSSSSLQYE